MDDLAGPVIIRILKGIGWFFYFFGDALVSMLPDGSARVDARRARRAARKRGR
ncbi:hypothetical protein ABZZ17_23395 [Streptomyces sp. NPDC006512]|uniref:hypothetical protein n=1 Tax=Streptomyces sp. NPDC006512 TaxID=3154307 RepID=UPI0033B32298